MSDVKFSCPNCTQSLAALEEMQGQAVDCPSCGKPVRIPSARPPETRALKRRIEKLFKEHRYPAALLLAQELCAVTAASFGDQHPDAIQARANLGIVCLKAGDPLQAEWHLRLALEGERLHSGEGSPAFGKVLSLLKRAAGDEPLVSQTAEHIAALEQGVRARALQFACPACGRGYSGPPLVHGQRVECPGCEAAFDVAGRVSQAAEPCAPVLSSAPPVPAADMQAAPAPAPTAPAPTPQSSPTPPPATNVVASDRLDYCFTLVTAGWIRMNSTEEEAQGADVALDHENLGVFKVVVSDWTLTFEDLCKGIEEAYKQEIQQYRRITMARTTVAGLPAVCLVYEGIDPGTHEPIRVISYAFLNGGKMHQVLAIGDPITFGALKREAAAAVQTFSFDAALARQHRGMFPRQKTPWWRFLSIRPVALPGRIQALLAAGLKWAMVGGIIGALFGINGMGSARNFFGKLVMLSIWVFAGGFVASSFKWGQIGAFSGGGHQALDKLIQFCCIPFHIMEFMLGMVFPGAKGIARVMTAFYRFIAYPIGFVSSGALYVAYVGVTRQTHLSAGLYVVLAIVGGFLGLMGIGLLMSIGGLVSGAR